MQFYIFIIVCLSTSQIGEKEWQKLGQKMRAWERAKQKVTEQKSFLFPSGIVQVHKPKQGVHSMKSQLDFKYSFYIH